VILSGVRTGFGAFGGSLKDHSATDLATIAAEAAIGRACVAPDQVDHVVVGNVLQTSADAPYLARHVGLRAGIPMERPAVTVNRLWPVSVIRWQRSSGESRGAWRAER
jgi:acetyl-CoA acetyltransferase